MTSLLNEAFWRRLLQQAIAMREGITDLGEATAYWLVNAESDGLPGLVVDRYNDFLVIQVLRLGMERQKDTIVRLLMELLEPRGIVERSDVDVREKEGLPTTVGVRAGTAPPETLETNEHGRRFLVDLMRGHKTGFYLDQRVNRRRMADYARGREVLNAFAYTGGFGVYAATAGATSVVHIDTIDTEDINWLAFRLLRPGGTLFTFLCSGLVSPELFQKVVFGAAVDAGCDAGGFLTPLRSVRNDTVCEENGNSDPDAVYPGHLAGQPQ